MSMVGGFFRVPRARFDAVGHDDFLQFGERDPDCAGMFGATISVMMMMMMMMMFGATVMPMVMDRMVVSKR